MCNLDDFMNLKMDDTHRLILERELELWHEWYLPCAQGDMIQIDIGAGNGETAQFYLNHGAKHVVCFEPDADLLYDNFGKDPRITIIRGFVGNIKSDGEGCERNMSLEIHFPFKLKFATQSTLADAYTSTWKLVALAKTEKASRLMDFHILRLQLAHFIRRSLEEFELKRLRRRL